MRKAWQRMRGSPGPSSGPIRAWESMHPDYRPGAPFYIDDTYDGRTLIVTGPWTPHVERELRRAQFDSVWLNTYRGYESSPDLQFLSPVPVSHLLIIDEGLRSFSGVEVLEGTLEGITIADCDPSVALDLSLLPHLTRVAADWRQIQASLSRNPSVRWLRVMSGFSGTDLRCFPAGPQLEALRIYGARRLVSLVGIEDFAGLMSLRLLVAPRLEDIAPVRALGRTLQELVFDGCSRISSLDGIEALTKLRWLGINDCRDVESLKPVRGLKRLEEVRLRGNTRIVDGDMVPLTELPKLKFVNSRHCRHYSPPMELVKRGKPGILGAPSSPWN